MVVSIELNGAWRVIRATWVRHYLTPAPSHTSTLCIQTPKKVDYLLFVRTGIIPHPAAYELESYSPKRGTAPNPKRPFFVFLLQVSGVDDRRRTLTPLALRYSILSESTLGINLFVLICTPFPRRLWVSSLPLTLTRAVLTRLTQHILNTAGGALVLGLHLTLTRLTISLHTLRSATSEVVDSPLPILCPAKATKWNPMLLPRFSQWDWSSRYEDGYYIGKPWPQLGRWVGEFEVEKHSATDS